MRYQRHINMRAVIIEASAGLNPSRWHWSVTANRGGVGYQVASGDEDSIASASLEVTRHLSMGQLPI